MKHPKPGQGDADLAASLEEDADRINDARQPDWEALAEVEAEAHAWTGGSRGASEKEALLDRAAEAAAHRPELLAPIAAILGE